MFLKHSSEVQIYDLILVFLTAVVLITLWISRILKEVKVFLNFMQHILTIIMFSGAFMNFLLYGTVINQVSDMIQLILQRLLFLLKNRKPILIFFKSQQYQNYEVDVLKKKDFISRNSALICFPWEMRVEVSQGRCIVQKRSIVFIHPLVYSKHVPLNILKESNLTGLGLTFAEARETIVALVWQAKTT